MPEEQGWTNRSPLFKEQGWTFLHFLSRWKKIKITGGFTSLSQCVRSGLRKKRSRRHPSQSHWVRDWWLPPWGQSSWFPNMAADAAVNLSTLECKQHAGNVAKIRNKIPACSKHWEDEAWKMGRDVWQEIISPWGNLRNSRLNFISWFVSWQDEIMRSFVSSRHNHSCSEKCDGSHMAGGIDSQPRN